jgi:2-polyprenyl-3-methyl-5-hydroxy-6-metoxy-1,4-benzoquinol methylase
MTVAQPCPICGHTSITTFPGVQDFSVSKEMFSLNTCSSCGFLFTSNPPDKSSIGKYYQSDAYISHTDGKKGFIEQVYQLVRKRTVAGKRKLVEEVVNKKRGTIIDYGCGTGAFLHEMNSFGWSITGIEPDAGARAKAEKTTSSTIFLPDQLSDLESGVCDAVTMWHVLEHVHDLDWTIQQLKRVLKPSGKLFIAVPNNDAFDANYYGKYWAAYDVPRHLYHFTPATMKVLMDKHGFNIIETKPMWFDSFYVSMLSEKYKTGKTGYIAAFFIGLISNFKALLHKGKCSSQIYVLSK